MILPRKVQFLIKAQADATTLAQVISSITTLNNIYFDRGYNVGGVDPITDEDLSGYSGTADVVGSFITMSSQLVNFANNAAVSQGDYDATLSKLRTDA